MMSHFLGLRFFSSFINYPQEIMQTRENMLPATARKFVPAQFKASDWNSISGFFRELEDRELKTKRQVVQWLEDESELMSILEEDLAWRYIKMTCSTEDEGIRDAYNYFVEHIQPKVSEKGNVLNKKLIASGFMEELESNGYKTLIRAIRNRVEIFREENIPLFTKIDMRAQSFDKVAGSMTVKNEGKELTMQQANALLEHDDRGFREKIYTEIAARRIDHRGELDELYSDLVKLRHEVAQNAGFKNYADYKFRDLERFDYAPEDCKAFHESVEKVIKPFYIRTLERRRTLLGVETLRPWDLTVDMFGGDPLKPFKDESELIELTISMFDRLGKELGDVIRKMRELGHLDLVSRKAKAPGGYNYPLLETGIPFIFMNAVGTQSDIVTMVHEGGHAIHAWLTKDLSISAFKDVPSEVAELASMAMELISMEHWDLIYSDPEQLRKAKIGQMTRTLSFLPWIIAIDAFQQWVYENPAHTVEERTAEWLSIYQRFHGDYLDWSGFEQYKAIQWQKQGHLFDVPFYYIEYGMAQLGALAVWKNYRENPEKGLQQYLDALKLGYTGTIPEIYEAAGIRFDFSAEYLAELTEFVDEEIAKLF